MKNLIIALACLLLVSNNSYAKTGILMPPKDSKVYVTSRMPQIITYGNKDVAKIGYWQPVDDQSKADYIINYKVRKSWTISYLHRNMMGCAQITNAKTGEVVYTTKRANTLWSMVSFNHKKTIVKKLNRRIERTI